MSCLWDTRLLVGVSTVGLSLTALWWWRSQKGSIANIKLTYLDIKGIAEPIRLTFAVGGIDFDDHRVSYKHVSQMRTTGTLPYGQVPILQVGDQIYSQSTAILRWAGIKAGLYPFECQPLIDGVEECLADIKKFLIPQWYKNALARSPVTGDLFTGTTLSAEQQHAVLNALNDVILPEKFAQLERVLQRSGGSYFCGEKMSICDLSFYSLASGILLGDYCDGLDPATLADCPRLLELTKTVANHPRVAAWNTTVQLR
eukprot:m.166759 g.166759  ORF g.166759 m.166759 type:complete len:257 (+) comp18167_c0_seq2:146-916(+)